MVKRNLLVLNAIYFFERIYKKYRIFLAEKLFHIICIVENCKTDIIILFIAISPLQEVAKANEIKAQKEKDGKTIVSELLERF